MAGLRVATYNVYLGADLSLMFGAVDEADLTRRARRVYRQARATDFPSRAEAIAALLVRERVDVIGLQEVAQWSRAPLPATSQPEETWCDFLDELTRALGRAGAAYLVHAVNVSFAGSAAVSDGQAMSVVGHNVTLVRGDSGVQVNGCETGRFRAALDIATPMAGLTFHVARSWGWIDATVDGTPFRFANTHIEAHDATVRDAQRDELLGLLEQPEPPAMPLVVVGDLNADPTSVGMPSSYTDAWVAAGEGGAGYTCGQAPDLANPESSLHERIDYVWARHAAVAGCRVVGDRAADRTRRGLWPSDHACVVADLVL